MFLSNSPGETKKIGKKAGREILKKEGPFVISLKGNLGGGKTTFVKGLAQSLGVREEIVSPTFVILKRYMGEKGRVLYHIDAYRVEKEDLLNLGLEEFLKDKDSVVVIEWGDKVEKILPKDRTEVVFEFKSPRERQLIVTSKDGIMTGST